MSKPFVFNVGDKVINGYNKTSQVQQQSAFDDAENSYFCVDLESQQARWWNESVLTATSIA